MKNLATVLCLILASISSFGQCPTIYTVTGGGTYCGGSAPVLTLSSSETGVVYQLYSERYHSISPPVSGTGSALSMNLPGFSDSWQVLARRGACTDTMSGVATVVSGIPTRLASRSVCVGDSTNMLDSASGGVWTSSNPSIASISIIAGTDSTRARVWGVSAGTVTITYTVTGACGTNSVTTTDTVGVISAPATLAGPDTICQGGYGGTFTSSVSLGGWSVASSSIATIDGSGLAYGLSAGVTTLSFSYYASCGSLVVSTRMLVVSSASSTSAPITGPFAVIAGSTAALAFTGTASGIWGTITGSIASVSATGVVRALVPGLEYITYDYDSSICHIRSLHFMDVVPTGVYVGDSIYSSVSSMCQGGIFDIKSASYSSANILVTYYGDGSFDTTHFFGWSVRGRDTFRHYYTSPGTYSVRHVLFNGSTPIDTLTYSYLFIGCREILINAYWDVDSNCTMGGSDYVNGFPLNLEVDSNGHPIDTLSFTSGLIYGAYGGIGDIYSFRLISAACSIGCASGYFSDTITSLGFTHSIHSVPLRWLGHRSFDLAATITCRTGRHTQVGEILAYTAGDTISSTATLRFNPRFDVYVSSPHVTSSSSGSGSATWNLGNLRPGAIPERVW